MIKLLRFLLPICILLLSGFFPQKGHSYNESVGFSLVQNAYRLAFDGNIRVQQCQDLIFKSALSNLEGENGTNHTANLEEKEDELVFFKKYTDISNGLTSTFNTQTPSYFSHFIKRPLFLNKHFSYFPYYKFLYLKFNVLRI
ncbi:hypothetical protein [Dyadobacter sp. NIV53]|uniref:hypothetical protein n=1 Tax=Dyadobacter sp. NIV53 TaxID=2861765 RepID=UPI001C88DA82|nr:hypothetical protein [Dyadobacter sp. NIV53]